MYHKPLCRKFSVNSFLKNPFKLQKKEKNHHDKLIKKTAGDLLKNATSNISKSVSNHSRSLLGMDMAHMLMLMNLNTCLKGKKSKNLFS